MSGHHRAILALSFALVVLAGVPAAVAQQAAAQQAAAQQAAAQEQPKAVWINPVRGTAEIQYIMGVPRQEKDMIVTTFQVKNMSSAPIARLTIEEYWWDKNNNPVTGDKQFLKKPLPVGAVETIVLRTPKNPNMYRNTYKFSHQNGDIKPKKVTKF